MLQGPFWPELVISFSDVSDRKNSIALMCCDTYMVMREREPFSLFSLRRRKHHEGLEQAVSSRAGSWPRGHELFAGRDRHHLTFCVYCDTALRRPMHRPPFCFLDRRLGGQSLETDSRSCWRPPGRRLKRFHQERSCFSLRAGAGANWSHLCWLYRWQNFLRHAPSNVRTNCARYRSRIECLREPPGPARRPPRVCG